MAWHSLSALLLCDNNTKPSWGGLPSPRPSPFLLLPVPVHTHGCWLVREFYVSKFQLPQMTSFQKSVGTRLYQAAHDFFAAFCRCYQSCHSISFMQGALNLPGNSPSASWIHSCIYLDAHCYNLPQCISHIQTPIALISLIHLPAVWSFDSPQSSIWLLLWQISQLAFDVLLKALFLFIRLHHVATSTDDKGAVWGMMISTRNGITCYAYAKKY